MTVKVLKKILVTTDFSELSLAGLEYAAAIYDWLGVQIYLLHVVDKGHGGEPSKPKKQSADILNDLNTIANRHLSACADVKKIVRSGDPYKEIVDFADEEKMDLIIISTHGRTGIAHVLLGSVTERVVRHSLVPVLTVKPVTIQMKLMEQEDIDEQLHLKQ